MSIITRALKQAAKSALVASRIPGLLPGRSRNDFVLTYHGISEGMPVELFRKQLRHLRSHFTIVPLEELLNADTNSTRRRIAITFDDGLKTTGQVMLPMLKEHSLPATMFVCSRLVDHSDALWVDKARWQIRDQLSEETLSLLRRWKIDVPNGINFFIEWMKILPNDQREIVKAVVQKQHDSGTDSTGQSLPDSMALMTWDELEALDSDLFEIGSHSLDHPILTSLSSEELESQLKESRERIETKLKRRVRYFSYPNSASNPEVAAACARHYEAAFTLTNRALQYPISESDLHSVPRVCAPYDMTDFLWLMSAGLE